jgi:hypothetical protein
MQTQNISRQTFRRIYHFIRDAARKPVGVSTGCLNFNESSAFLNIMPKNSKHAKHFFTLLLILILVGPTHGQKECRIFKDYRNEIKVWGESFFDSLRHVGVDTIIFYGVGVPNTGRIAYGKIIWVSNGRVSSVEIKITKYNEKAKAYDLAPLKYNFDVDLEPIQFYSNYRLDTVTTNPEELFWMSHDYLHFVYSVIGGKTVCFIAENYLLLDREHLRSRWINILCGNVPPHLLIR